MQVAGLQLGPAAPFANDSQLFFPVAALLESSVPEESKAALQVLLCVIVAASMPCLHHLLSSLSVCSGNVLACGVSGQCVLPYSFVSGVLVCFVSNMRQRFVLIQTMQVLDAVMRYSDRGPGEDPDAEQRGLQVEVLHWAAAIDDTGQCTLYPLHRIISAKTDFITHPDLGKQIAAGALLHGVCVDLSN